MEPPSTGPDRGPEQRAADVPVRPDEVVGDHLESQWHTRAGQALAGLVRRTRSWLAADVVLATMLLSSVLVLGIATWGAGALYESVKDADGLARLDQPVLDWFRGIRTPPADAAIAAFTDLAGPAGQPWLLVPVSAFLGWRWRSWTPLVLCVLAYGGASILTSSGKSLVGRARPPFEAAVPPFQLSPSFPSGHTIFGVVVAGIVCYLFVHWFTSHAARVALVLVGVLYAVAMGLSRVYLGHHWLTDVAAGWLVGLGWLWVVMTLHRLWLTARRKHGEQRFGVLPEQRKGGAR